MIAFRIKHPVC